MAAAGRRVDQIRRGPPFFDARRKSAADWSRRCDDGVDFLYLTARPRAAVAQPLLAFPFTFTATTQTMRTFVFSCLWDFDDTARIGSR